MLIAARQQCILFSIGLYLGTGFAQTIPYEERYSVGQQLREGPLALDLHSSTGGRTGKVWLRQTDEGILIFGRAAGPPPKYARFPLEMNSRDHVGLWLSASRDVRMPEIGWAISSPR